MTLQTAKDSVLAYIKAFDKSTPATLQETLKAHTHADYLWRGVHPFNEINTPAQVITDVWAPLRESFSGLHRRMDFFFGGENASGRDAEVWVLNAGQLMGLFDENWIGIPSTGRLTTLRYAEFHSVRNGKITESALFLDILYVMKQAGVYPLPPMTGAPDIFPGPRTQDGLKFAPQNELEGKKTLDLVNRMIDDLTMLNEEGLDDCPPDLLAKTWHDDMAWYGSAGIGATYTIPRYQEHHQFPFRKNLADKVFNGHVARAAEGNYCGFFGWPNLNNRNKGGFLGLPESNVHAPMRVVDLYRRDGDKLAENWVYFDFLHYLMTQGLDVLERCRKLNRT